MTKFVIIEKMERKRLNATFNAKHIGEKISLKIILCSV